MSASLRNNRCSTNYAALWPEAPLKYPLAIPHTPLPMEPERWANRSSSRRSETMTSQSCRCRVRTVPRKDTHFSPSLLALGHTSYDSVREDLDFTLRSTCFGTTRVSLPLASCLCSCLSLLAASPSPLVSRIWHKRVTWSRRSVSVNKLCGALTPGKSKLLGPWRHGPVLHPLGDY